MADPISKPIVNLHKVCFSQISPRDAKGCLSIRSAIHTVKNPAAVPNMPYSNILKAGGNMERIKPATINSIIKTSINEMLFINTAGLEFVFCDLVVM